MGKNSSTDTILMPLNSFSLSRCLSPEIIYFASASIAKYRNLSSDGSSLIIGLEGINNGFLITRTFSLLISSLTSFFGVISILLNLEKNSFLDSTPKSSSIVSKEKQIRIFLPSINGRIDLLTLLLQRKAEIRIVVSRITLINYFALRYCAIAFSMSYLFTLGPASCNLPTISASVSFAVFRRMIKSSLDSISKAGELLKRFFNSFGKIIIPCFEILISFIQNQYRLDKYQMSKLN